MALPIFQRTVTDDAGNIVVGATVTVKSESTGLVASIFSDRAGSTELANPFTTGANGLATFYAAPGEYRIEASNGVSSITWRYQVMAGTGALITAGTAAELDAVTNGLDATEGRLLKVGATIDQLDATNSNIEFVPDVAATMDFNYAENTFRIYDSLANSFKDVTLVEALTHARSSDGTGVDPIGRVGTVGVNVPRLVFDEGVSKGYLSEEQRTNLLTNSEFPNGLSDATGNSTGISLASLDYGDGIVNSIFFDSGALRAAYKTNFTPTIGVAYTFSCIVEMSDGLSPSFSTTAIGNDFLIYMNSSPISVTSYNIEKLYGKTYRVFCTSVSANASTSYGVVKLVSNSPRTFKVTGYQLEAGSFPTSYIKTESSTVTRAADSMVRTLGQEWNPNEGAIVVSGTYTAGDTILSSGAWSLVADVTGYKKYAENVILDTTLTLGNGMHERLMYYPIDLSSIDLERLAGVS